MRYRQYCYPVRLILGQLSELDWIALLAVVLLAILQAGAVAGASYFDGTWWLPHGGKGFLNHYGVWAILVADPCALIATAIAWRQFKVAMMELPAGGNPEHSLAVLRLISPYIRFVKLRGNGIHLYLLLVMVGLLGWVNNIYQTTDPVRFFGHKVFDSTEFMYGFLANKFVLFVSWALVYPACGFVTLSMCLSTFLILQKMKSQRLMRPTVFHPDGCYGYSALGMLNVCLMVPFVIAFVVLFSILITHARLYASIVVPLVFLTLVFLSVSVVTIYPIVSQTKKVEGDLYDKLRFQSRNVRSLDFRTQLSFGVERLCFALSQGSPYSKTSRAMLAVLRAIPVTITVVKLVLPLV